MNKYAILINSTDSFEDCWIPFFTLFKRYWPEYSGEIYLNTETKSFSFNNLNIISVQNNIRTPNTPITWSECLIRALKAIDNEIVLYMQEDYFIKDTVKNDMIEKYVKLMHENPDIHCIHLTDQAVKADKSSPSVENLYPATYNQRYRISCQAALWRKDVLISYLRPYENAWQFEEFGSKRGAILKHNFYVVDNGWVMLNTFEILPYIFTGIIQGRWFEEVIPLFDKNKINVDFYARGFVKDVAKKSLLQKLLNKYHRIPILIKHYLNITLLNNKI